MELYQKIVTARKQKGITQEQLADLSKVTVRTIQRIESGESIPRAFTLKAIAGVLEMSFEDLTSDNHDGNGRNFFDSPQTSHDEDSKHFLTVLCLSCFSYLVIPFIHFLIPTYILKKSNEKNPAIIAFAKKVIRIQLYWKVALCLLLLGTLAYNLTIAAYSQKSYLLHYLVPFFAMYLINAILISIHLVRIKKMGTLIKLPD